MLFQSWLTLPTSDQIKGWHDKKSGEPVIEKSDEENFKALGYTSEQIKRMKSELEKAGFRQS